MIRKGQQGTAREILLTTQFKKIPRAQVVEFADLARRLNMPKLMLSLLKPIVRKELPLEAPATNRENSLYATALSRIGVFPEAQSILKKLDMDENAEALLFLAQNMMLQWDYLTAIPKLKKYVNHPQVSPYMKRVGRVNLASSLIGEMKWDEAEKELQALRTEIEDAPANPSEGQSNELLYANVMGLMAHGYFLRRDLEKAKECIQKSAKILSGSQSRYELLAKKWYAVIHLFQNPNEAGALRELRFLRDEAVKARDWETARDFEFYEALSRRDDDLFLRLYHGTPYTSYRKRIKKIYQPEMQIPKMVDWVFADPKFPQVERKNLRVFDLSKGCEVGGSAALTKQPMLFRLLQFLTKDFYRPMPLGAVFAHLYPKEKFNPESSPNRTYMIAKRLRAWFEDQGIPLDIEVDNELFRLKALEPYVLRISFRNFNVSKNEALLESAQKFFGSQRFSALQLGESLGLPASRVQRFLTWAVGRRKMRRLKVGRSSLFILSARVG
jgi:tetratricopeptide (TPR) repeat protein